MRDPNKIPHHGETAMNIRRFIPLVGAVLFAAPASAQVSSTEALAAFNAERAMYPGVGPLQWSPQLATYSQNWADRSAERDTLMHRPDTYDNPLAPGQWVGETGFQGEFYTYTVSDAVRAWVAEKQWYHYDQDDGNASRYSTPPGCTAPSGASCGHFTQVIWKNTQFVGCGSGRAADGTTYIFCNYYPSGDYPGQKPY
jgi:pathogenesis-related protein 1